MTTGPDFTLSDSISKVAEKSLETHFNSFREGIIGIDIEIETPYGKQPLIYSDWTASGRLYGPIEQRLIKDFYPLVGNTHTGTNHTGASMTEAYHQAIQLIKEHVNASCNDVLISCNSGMTGVVNKFQRILGLRIHERYSKQIDFPQSERPVVFVTHMEHHSNQTSWLETIADVVVVPADEDGKVCAHNFKKAFEKYAERPLKIAAVTACSNVTGIQTPYHAIAKEIHNVGGLCFADFACSAPYVDIDMHPEEEGAYLDAVYFSPHKFLGGPGSTGILVFNKALYNNQVPDNSGGGTVDWTNPWGEHKYTDDIEAREDGGTPAFLQTIRIALCIQLKDKMGVDKMAQREHELIAQLWSELESVENLHVLASEHEDRLSICSFYVDDLHFNLATRLLNDRFGIQVRGGCSCAGTYGHYLLDVSQEHSKGITDQIDQGVLTGKPGWVRLSLHPTTTNEELAYITNALKSLAINHKHWANDYVYQPAKNEFAHRDEEYEQRRLSFVKAWFMD